MAVKLKGTNGALAQQGVSPLALAPTPSSNGAAAGGTRALMSLEPAVEHGSRARKGGGSKAETKAAKAAKEALKADKEAQRDLDRKAELFLRIAHGKHESLSSLADNKAHIMLTINVGIVGVCATQIFDPQLQYAAITLMVGSLAAAALAVYVTMPAVPKHTQARPSDPNFDLAFFGDFARLPFDVYRAEMDRFLHNRDEVISALARDLYWLGKVLNDKKYRYLAYCYRVFFAGLFLSAVVLAITVALSWQ